MPHAAFAPGFRLSAVDVVVLVGGMISAIVLSMNVWWWGFVCAFVLAHFFFFCNVIRMARPLELIWAGIFVALAGTTVVNDTPGWLVTTFVSLFVTAVVVIIEMRKPSYHGLGWQWINPELPAWWAARLADAQQSTHTSSPE